ncbi:MAG: hypothetical protein MPJ81_07480, partial [Gammaproteobacteria bacterium]|nr:hypothetical protein [Gammaproteobacteria bacterium]MDA8012219.1 hypothetical protein [Gammaproteobacteria bacterium]
YLALYLVREDRKTPFYRQILERLGLLKPQRRRAPRRARAKSRTSPAKKSVSRKKVAAARAA